MPLEAFISDKCPKHCGAHVIRVKLLCLFFKVDKLAMFHDWNVSMHGICGISVILSHCNP